MEQEQKIQIQISNFMKNEHMGNVLGFFEIFSEWENRGGDGRSADGSQEGAPLKDVLPHPTTTLHATLFTFLILVNICFAETTIQNI